MRYEKLFTHMNEEHGVCLLETEMQEIYNIVSQTNPHVFDQVIAWQEQTFGEPNPDGIRAHIKKELNEILEATTLEHKLEELIDCFFMLLQEGRRIKPDITSEDIFSAMQAKLDVNKARIWAKPGPDGAIHHVKDQSFTNGCSVAGHYFEYLVTPIEGGFVGVAKTVQGATSNAKTLDQLTFNMSDAIRTVLEAKRESLI